MQVFSGMAIKMYCAFLFITLSATCPGFTQTAQPDTSTRPAITAIGQPFGGIASAKIDNKGGSLTSADGKLQIIFPEGALKKKTTISIQPVTNLLAETETGAYRLEPSGIQFEKPVKLIFSLEGDTTMAAIANLATQDAGGRWWALKEVERDAAGKYLSGEVTHFSDWGLFSSYSLQPVTASVKVNGSRLLEVKQLTAEAEAKNGGLIQYGVPLITKKVAINKWTVNGVINGNSETGTIDEAQKRWGIYVAPAKPPSKNPVTVTAYFSGKFDDLSGTRYKNFSLSSSIKVLEEGYRFTYIHKSFAGCFHFVDSSSCIVKLEGETALLTDITNYKPWSNWDPCTTCKFEWLNKETFKANVEITGLSSSSVYLATKHNPVTVVKIQLLPAFGTNAGQRLTCPDRYMPVRTVPVIPLPADPKYIQFTDGPDGIIVEYMGRKAKDVIHVKLKNEETIIKVTKL